jgi:hypothetical protein
MIFSDEDAPPTPPNNAPDTGGAAADGAGAKTTRTRPQLKVVK